MGEDSAKVGILRSVMDSAPLKGLGLVPQFSEREITVELTNEQLKNLLLKDTDDRAKSSVSVECKEGKLVLKIRLW